MATQPTFEELQTAAAEAVARAQAAQAEVERAARETEERRQEGLKQHDARVLDELDQDALDAEVAEAEAKLREAILADPVYAATIEAYQARVSRAHRLNEAYQAARNLGRATFSRGYNVEQWATHGGGADAAAYPISLDELVPRVINAEAQARAADDQDARDAARVEAGERAARGGGRRG